MRKSNSNLIPILVGIIYDSIVCLKTPFDGLAPIDEVKDVLIHIRFNIVTIAKNVLNTANSTDPDETPRFVASQLGLRYL